MITNLLEKRRTRCYSIIFFGLMLLCSSALADEISFDPAFDINMCDSTDTLWINFDDEITGVEAASITVDYDASYFTITDVIKSAGLGSNGQIFYTDAPADDSIIITVAVLTGAFDGPGDFVGIVLTSDAEVSTTPITFLNTDLRDDLNQSITHTTSFGAAITIDCTQPVVTCPSDITQGNDVGECDAVVTFTPTATDNFTGSPSIVAVPASGSTFPVGTTPVQVIATDAAGNADTCIFDIIVNDNEDPVVTSCPSDISQTADVGVCNAAVTVAALTATDNCGVATIVNDFNATADASGTYPVGTTVVTWTVTDIHGNFISTCQTSVTVTDDEDPVVTSCPSDISQTADVGVCNAAVTVAALTATDNCGVATIVNDFNATADASGTYPVGTTVVTWTVTDIHGNFISTCQTSVTVTDDEDPVVTSCPSDVSQTAGVGVCNAAVTVAALTATDNCGVATIVNDFNATADASGTYPVGTTVVTWTVTDIHGNFISTCQTSVTVTDDEDPVVTSCPSDISQTADVGVCNAAVTVAALTATDNCGVATIVNDFNATADASGTYPVGTTVVTWTVTDIHGNFISTCQTSVTVTDDEDPVVTSCPSDISQTADVGVCNAAVTVAALTATDNCGVATIVNDFNATADASGTYPVGTTVVTWTVTDIHGNFISTCQTSVTVTDDEDPVVTSCPSDVSQTADVGVCNAAVTVAALTATDNCGVATIVNDFNATADASGTYPVGTTVVTWTVTDIHGNFISTCQTSVTVTDDEDPVVTSCPSDISQTADVGVCNAAVTVAALTATDNCGVATIVNDFNATADASGTYPVGTTVVTWTVTDIHGNFISTCQTSVTVTDDEDPVVTSCPSDISQTADVGVCNAAVTVAALTATDNCGVATIVNDFNATADASGTYPVGTTVVTWTVTDIHGNFISTCQTSVTVTDDEDPVVTSCPSDISQTADVGVCNAAVTVAALTATDNCGVATIVNDFNATADASDTYPVGTTVVTWTVTDIHGNFISTCQTSVTVTDDEDPVVTSCPSDISQTADVGVCNAAVTVAALTATDNCGVATIVNDFNATADASGTYPVGTTVVTWTVTDIHGNFISTCQTSVTVTDNENPVVTCPADVPTAGCAQTDPGFTGTATATDNCDPSPVISYSDAQVGNVITRTWTATDVSTNSHSCDQIITINDYSAPTMQTVAEAEGQYYNTAPVFSTFGFTDDCDLNDGFYQIDGFGAGTWISLFTDVSGTTWNDNGWVLPGFGALAEGTHTVYFMADDDVDNAAGGAGEISWQFYKDISAPAAATAFTVEAGHEKCKLSWTNPTGDATFAGVEIRRNPWAVGAYPEYDDGGAAMGYPADETLGDLVYQGPLEIFRDTNNTTTMPRNVYYYSIFSYDLAGNYSTATSAQQGRATNYWLGDIGPLSVYDGIVNFDDLTTFSNAYGTSSGPPPYDNEWDIGPTYSGSPKGIPETDNEIQFEDLVIFAINFGAVDDQMKVAPIFMDEKVSGPLALSLRLPSGDLKVGEEFPVSVILRNNPGTVKGMHLLIPYDPDRLELVGITKGHQLEDAPYPVFFDGRDIDGKVDMSLALLGGKSAIGGSGEISTLTFRLLKAGNVSFGFDLIDLRDSENHKLLTEEYTGGYELVAGIPVHYELGRNIPNPFNPITQIAYQLPKAGEVSLKIFNIRGQVVRTLVNKFMPAGNHEVVWDGRSDTGHEVASGIYLYRMKSGDFSATRKMVLLK